MNTRALGNLCIGDLHAHTTDSDGSRTNSERAQEAIELDVKKTGVWALTNHDVYSPSFVSEVRASGLKAVYGTEISAYSKSLDLSLHVTCYTPVITESVRKLVSGIVEARKTKVAMQIQKLQAQGFPINEPEFYAWIESQRMSIGFASNWHIAVYLWKNREARKLFREATSGKVRSAEGVLQECLKKTGDYAQIGHYQIGDYEPSLETLAELAEKDEMVLSIAHPNFSFLKHMNLQGVEGGSSAQREYFCEVIHPKLVNEGVRNLEINALTDKEWAQAIRSCTQKVNGLITFGSDNHGKSGPDSRHGVYGQVNENLRGEDVEGVIKKLSSWV